MKYLLLASAFFTMVPAFASSPQPFFNQFIGSYAGVDADGGRSAQASFKVSVQNGRPVVSSSNISQDQGCDLRVGQFLGIEQSFNGEVVATFALRKGAGCDVQGTSIDFTFYATAIGCSEGDPRISGIFLNANSMGGFNHNIPHTSYTSWNLFKSRGC